MKGDNFDSVWGFCVFCWACAVFVWLTVPNPSFSGWWVASPAIAFGVMMLIMNLILIPLNTRKD